MTKLNKYLMSSCIKLGVIVALWTVPVQLVSLSLTLFPGHNGIKDLKISPVCTIIIWIEIWTLPVLIGSTDPDQISKSQKCQKDATHLIFLLLFFFLLPLVEFKLWVIFFMRFYTCFWDWGLCSGDVNGEFQKKKRVIMALPWPVSVRDLSNFRLAVSNFRHAVELP